MRMLGRLVVVIAAALGGLAGAQFPEFAQQYRQRLGGALEEVGHIVADFDADVERGRLTRAQALEAFDRSGEAFLRDRGISTRSTLARYDRLFEQKVRLEAAPPLLRPVVVLNRPDMTVIRGAWSDFEPAMPVTPAAFVWAAVGFFIAGGLVSLLRQLVGAARRRRGSGQAGHMPAKGG